MEPGNKIHQVLNNLLESISMQPKSREEKNIVFANQVKENLANFLKKDAMFRLLFIDVVWTGSHADGLKNRVIPDEFDMNIILKLPVKDEKEIKLVAKAMPGYLEVQNFGNAIKGFKDDPIWKTQYDELVNWSSCSGNLLQTKLTHLVEVTMDNFARNYNQIAAVDLHMTMSKSGPATTMSFNGLKLSIDVVFVFEIKTTKPPTPIRCPQHLDKKWYILYKPMKAFQGKDEDAWRVSFPQHEKDILNKYNGMIKPAIKLVKKMRDTQNWDQVLNSYVIKTVALWIMSDDKEICKSDDSIYSTFLKLLAAIAQYLESGFLPFYWDKRHNLIAKGNEHEYIAIQMRALITKFTDHLETEPKCIIENIVGKTN